MMNIKETEKGFRMDNRNNKKCKLFTFIVCSLFVFSLPSSLFAERDWYKPRKECPGGYYGRLPYYAYPRWYHDYYFRCHAYPRWYHGPSLEYWRNYPRGGLPERLQPQWREVIGN